jgi:hypothetical protein
MKCARVYMPVVLSAFLSSNVLAVFQIIIPELPVGTIALRRNITNTI